MTHAGVCLILVFTRSTKKTKMDRFRVRQVESLWRGHKAEP